MVVTQGKRVLIYGTFFILGSFFLTLGLVRAQAFLAPLVTAVIFSLLVLPLCRKMEKGPFNRMWASLLNTILLILASVVLVFLLSLQVRSFTNDWDLIKETMAPKLVELKTYLIENTPLGEEHFNSSPNSDPQAIGQNDPGTKAPEESAATAAGEPFSFLSMPSDPAGTAVGVLSSLSSLIGNFLLCFIYIFFFLNYRTRFKGFLMKLFPEDKRDEVKQVIEKSARVAGGYLVGKLLLMLVLFILYTIGLGISGVDNFIIVSALAAIFTLIPYIGNIIGMALAMSFGYLTSGDLMVLVGILLTFTISQFFESYVLQPFVVGDRVGLHPFFVILVVIIGNMIWGIIGMVLAIPVLGIFNVIFNHVKLFHPLAFLLNQEKERET